jgi:hypothetical protein
MWACVVCVWHMTVCMVHGARMPRVHVSLVIPGEWCVLSSCVVCRAPCVWCVQRGPSGHVVHSRDACSLPVPTKRGKGQVSNCMCKVRALFEKAPASSLHASPHRTATGGVWCVPSRVAARSLPRRARSPDSGAERARRETRHARGARHLDPRASRCFRSRVDRWTRGRRRRGAPRRAAAGGRRRGRHSNSIAQARPQPL